MNTKSVLVLIKNESLKETTLLIEWSQKYEKKIS